MYIVGQEETVGESSVSSGCWGEDSDHKYEWARRTPTFVAPIRFYHTFQLSKFPNRTNLSGTLKRLHVARALKLP